MTSSERSLGRYIEPALDDARLERQVAAIAAARGRRPRARRRFATLVATAAGLAVVGLAAWRAGASLHSLAGRPATVAGATVETPAEPETLTLADGSRAVLDPRSKLTLLTMRAELVRVALERGGVDLDVVHADGKEFVVLARGYEIRVLGTRFSVRLGDGGSAPVVVVEVVRGRVRVTRAGQEGDSRVLDAGEIWSAGSSAPVPARAPGAVAPETEPKQLPPARPRATATDAGESARQLLARAEAFRAANDPLAAARALDALRTRHRGDPRAGLAAFELGRLRLDRLGDPRGAVEALDDALSLAPGAPFREDAQARLVEAYAASGERTRCLDAQAAYLSRYPRGLQRRKVASSCPE
jgi:tetratricopeptide (TPR) repeat protein